MDKYLIKVKNSEPMQVTTVCKANDMFSKDGLIKAPDDISKLGKPIVRSILKSYPKNSEGRSFQADWFKRFEWIEYSKSHDAVFCYACRQFNPAEKKETVFTEKGFKNWKSALDKTKSGFIKHSASMSHLMALSRWREKENREEKGMCVSTIVNENVLERNRYYVKSIIEVIQFLAVNELSMRGTYYIDEHEEKSLFKNLFEFTLRKDERLRESYKHIPKNASYLSPEIQNEVIGILAETVREGIVNDIKSADVPYFTILEDGTRDKNNRENISLGVRYVKSGKIFESILEIETTSSFDAITFADIILNTLQKYGIPTPNILSQCFDGAKVMSGKLGGVQAIMQQKLGRKIPYVHCYNHRLHLVVIKAVSHIESLRKYFDYCALLHKFLSKGKVKSLYEGKTVSRLLEQQWSGHLQTTNVIHSNFDKIIEVLKNVQGENFSGKDVAQSIGLLSVIKGPEFRFSLVATKKILTLISPADKMLQSHQTTLKEAMNLISAVKENLSNLRNNEAFEELFEDSKALMKELETEVSASQPPKRRKLNKNFKDFILTEKVMEINDTKTSFKRIFYETIDTVVEELTTRFTDNDGLLEAIEAAERLDIDNNKLNLLSELGVNLPSKEEIQVVKTYLKRLED